MKRFVALCLVAVSFATAPAFADWGEGWVAYRKGDYKTALSEWKPLAEQGNARAQYNLGLMYNKGEGVVQDYKEAMKWYRLSAELGGTFAQSNLGFMYENGQGVLQDDIRAHMWYSISESNGNELAQKERDDIAKKMTPVQIKKAQDLARACVANDYKGC